MYFKQFYLGCLAHASYFIGDGKTGKAVVVDPQRDIDLYLKEASAKGFTIESVFLTHFHADFISGHLELRDRAGADIYLGAHAKAEYSFKKMADGGSVEYGAVLFEFLETPGHTPEAVSILVYDLDKDGRKPYAVLTGDTLFIGDVGRPDLLASAGFSERELGEMLYRSLHEKLLPLPDETLVYPAHGAGSFCGKSLSAETSSTIGIQRKHNYALQPMSQEEFIRLVASGQPEAPPYFSYDADLNRRERKTLDEVLRGVKPLAADAFLRLREGGAQIVDVRDPQAYAAAHLAGSLNIGLGGSYATWSGIVLDRGRPIAVIAEPGREEEAAVRLGRIGFDHLAGYLEGGMRALESRSDLLRSTARISALQLSEQLSGKNPPFVLDVRGEAEHQQKKITGSVNIPLPHLRRRISEIPAGPVVVHCAGGYRSSIAASILEQEGRRDVSDLIGGYTAWETSRPK